MIFEMENKNYKNINSENLELQECRIERKNSIHKIKTI
jgi:hypothetical protein